MQPLLRIAVLALLLAARAAPAAEPARDALAAGWENYRLSEFDRAARFFNEALAHAAAGSEEQLQALYGLGTTWNLRRPGEDRKKAESYYRRVLEANPRGDVGAWTALALARMKHLVPVGEDPDIPSVRAAYEQVMRDFPDHLVAKEAFIYRISTFIASLDPQEARYAIEQLEAFVSQPGAREFLQPAWSLMAVGYTTLGRQADRLQAEIRALETTEVDPSNPFTEFAWAYWNIATIAEFEVGDFPLARQYYRRLIQEYPRDIRIFGARQALARMDALEAKLRAGAGKAAP